MNRRSFLKRTSATAVALTLAPAIALGPEIPKFHPVLNGRQAFAPDKYKLTPIETIEVRHIGQLSDNIWPGTGQDDHLMPFLEELRNRKIAELQTDIERGILC